MFRMWTVKTVLTVAALVGCDYAGVGKNADQGEGFKIGDPAPVFKDLPAVDGKSYGLADFNHDVLVLVITCNHCPVAMAYEQRMIDFTKKYATGKDAKVAFIAVNINNGEQDRLDMMKVRAKDKGFNYTYLYDQSQKIGRQLNAHVTPEFYVFDKARKLVYWGPMDDNVDDTKVGERYLVPAVDAVLAGKAVPVALKKAFGCNLDYQK